ncbi:hypothetical protein [Deefgea rivuli]|uniref:hypothetical protein n=1 Tax=Deefgea rivuli TaxID=400948 RepID=UPI000483C170|nr:hypothetical protein [Deefgea rivuli]
MLKLAALAIFWREITVLEQSTPDVETELKFKVAFKRLPAEQLAQRTSPDATESVNDFLANVIADWQGVADESGEPLAYSANNLRYVLSVPGMSQLLFARYLTEVGNLREKN